MGEILLVVNRYDMVLINIHIYSIFNFDSYNFDPSHI